VDCERCGCTFRTLRGPTQHQAEGRGHCKLYEEMTGAHLVDVRKKGVVKDCVEKVTVKTCGGRAAKVCGKFVYLGTLMSPTARETEEVTRRCQKASGVFGTLRKVWQRRSINDRVKGRLFEAFVSSVLLYNAEVWPLRK